MEWKNILKTQSFELKMKKGNIIESKKFNELTSEEKNNVPPPPSPITKEVEEKNNKTNNIKEATGPEFADIIINNKTFFKISELETKPEYPGGMEAFYKFVGENFITPKTPEDVKLTGKVYLTFIIEADGNLSNFKILRDNFGYGTGEEAIRVLKLSPKWNPGTINGEAVRTLYSLPISIQTRI